MSGGSTLLHRLLWHRVATTTRSRLLMLVAALLVPAALFGTVLFWRLADAGRARYRDQTEELAQQISNSIDRELVAIGAALDVLATSPDLAPGGDLGRFHNQALALLRTRGSFIAMRDRTGQQIINTSQPFGTQLPRSVDPVLLAADRVVFETGKPIVSDLYVGAVTHLQLVLIDAPVVRNGAVSYALDIALDPARLADILVSATPPGWISSVIDKHDRIIARSRRHLDFLGQPPSPDLLQEATGTRGTWDGFTRDGTAALSAYVRSPVSGWRIAVGVPQSVVNAPLNRLTTILTGTALLVLVCAVGLAGLVARTIREPLSLLTTAAIKLGRGEAVPPVHTGLQEVDDVAAALGNAQSAISEREAALQASEARFRAAVRAVDGVLWTNDAEGRMTGDQPGWAALTGQGREEYQDYGWSKAVHPDDAQPTIDAWEHSVRERTTFVFSHRIRRHDGVYRRFSIRAVPVLGPHGEIREWVGVHTDITDEHEAQTSLAESQARLRAVFEAVPVGVVIADAPEGRIVHSNRQAERILGRGLLRSEGIDASGQWSSFHGNGNRVEAAEYPLARILAGEERPELEVLYREHGEGPLVWIRLIGAAIRDAADHLTGAVVAVLDIDREKRAEAELRELNATLERRVAETVAERDRIWRISTELMLIARFDGEVVAINPAWASTLGWTEQEMIGANFMDLVHPEDAERTRNESESLARGVTTLRFANRLRRKDGAYCWLSWTAVPEAGLLHAIARDITAEQESAEALRRAEAQLRQSQKMEVVGQLTGGVAHDFNNLLTVVSGNLEMAMRRLESGSGNERLERAIGAALQGARRAAVLTHRLLAFSRQSPLRPEPVDLNTIIAGMADLIGRTLGETIRIETRLAPKPWTVEADPNQLENAILNLCVNARDAMPEGGTLTLETRNVELGAGDPAVARAEIAAGSYAGLTVTDTGTGMTPDVQERAFEPFFTTKPVGKGTGLGLSQVFGFLRQSGGHVTIDSTPGTGTAVRLFLPCVAATERAAYQPRDTESVAAVQGTGETILVIEDEEMVREFTTLALEDAGFRVLAAPDGPAGLQILDENRDIALLFSDVVLAGPMNGRAVADEAKRRRPDLPVLFTTGYPRNVLMHGGRLDGGVEVITKPFTAPALLAKIKTLLERVPAGTVRSAGRSAS